MFKLFAGICLALLSLVSLIYCSTSIMLFRLFVSIICVRKPFGGLYISDRKEGCIEALHILDVEPE